MAAVKRLTLLAVAACGNVQGFGGPVPPLASFTVEATGDLASVRLAGDTGTPHLRLALVWGRQWLVEPMCIFPLDSRDDATMVHALIDAGCRDPFGFVPAVVAANVDITPNVPTELDLFGLPGADVMVGDLTARVAYGSFVVYNDRTDPGGNLDGTLTLAQPNRPPQEGPPNQNNLPTATADIVYGASMFAMTSPDQRVAYREGAFNAGGAFYPRAGCSDPPPGFSVLSASGFSFADAIQATIAGMLPQEDPASCTSQAPADATITISLERPSAHQTTFNGTTYAPDLSELRCSERITDATVRYREPDPQNMPDTTGRVSACVHHPSVGAPSDVIEWVVSGVMSSTTGVVEDPCAGLTHYILKGCREGPECPTPDWEDAPPTWWPCPAM